MTKEPQFFLHINGEDIPLHQGTQEIEIPPLPEKETEFFAKEHTFTGTGKFTVSPAYTRCEHAAAQLFGMWSQLKERVFYLTLKRHYSRGCWQMKKFNGKRKKVLRPFSNSERQLIQQMFESLIDSYNESVQQKQNTL